MKRMSECEGKKCVYMYSTFIYSVYTHTLLNVQFENFYILFLFNAYAFHYNNLILNLRIFIESVHLFRYMCNVDVLSCLRLCVATKCKIDKDNNIVYLPFEADWLDYYYNYLKRYYSR